MNCTQLLLAVAGIHKAKKDKHSKVDLHSSEDRQEHRVRSALLQCQENHLVMQRTRHKYQSETKTTDKFHQ